MPYNNADEITIAANGQVYIAPTSTPLPDDPTEALNAAFFGLGYISEDGAKFSATPQVTDTNAWQSNQAVRREFTGQELAVTFALLQWNEATVPLAFGGGAITEPSPGVFRYDFPQAGDALSEYVMVIDTQDGDKHGRLVIARGNVTDTVETNWKRTEASLLPITFKGLQPTDGGVTAYWLTDDADAFAAGS